jgi:disulfide bond formation protein DsbB
MKQETSSTIVQALPSASVIGATILGLSLPDWAAIAGIAFIVLQAVYLIWKWTREAKK